MKYGWGRAPYVLSRQQPSETLLRPQQHFDSLLCLGAGEGDGEVCERAVGGGGEESGFDAVYFVGGRRGGGRRRVGTGMSLPRVEQGLRQPFVCTQDKLATEATNRGRRRVAGIGVPALQNGQRPAGVGTPALQNGQRPAGVGTPALQSRTKRRGCGDIPAVHFTRGGGGL